MNLSIHGARFSSSRKTELSRYSKKKTTFSHHISRNSISNGLEKISLWSVHHSTDAMANGLIVNSCIHMHTVFDVSNYSTGSIDT